MTDFPASIPKNKIVLIVPGRLETMLAGVEHAEVSHDYTVTLIYIDGSRESRTSTRHDVLEMDGFLDMVSFVQSGR